MQISGRYRVTVENNIIVSRLVGGFNLEGISAYIEQIKQTVKSLGGLPFAILVDDTELEGATPEAYAELDGYNEWITRQNMVGKAFVINNAAKRAILIKNTPSLNDPKIAFFTSEDDAKAWLLSQFDKTSNHQQ